MLKMKSEISESCPQCPPRGSSPSPAQQLSAGGALSATRAQCATAQPLPAGARGGDSAPWPDASRITRLGAAQADLLAEPVVRVLWRDAVSEQDHPDAAQWRHPDPWVLPDGNDGCARCGQGLRGALPVR